MFGQNVPNPSALQEESHTHHLIQPVCVMTPTQKQYWLDSSLEDNLLEDLTYEWFKW